MLRPYKTHYVKKLLRKRTQRFGGRSKIHIMHAILPGMARVRISIVFESGARIGPGKAKLLKSIRDTGLISASARDMGMSYKRAWLLLDSINQAFTEPVVMAATGYPSGDDREDRQSRRRTGS